MKSETIDNLIHADPYVPFVLVMNSGIRYDVRRDWMAVFEGDVITVYHEGTARRDLLRLSQISSIEVLEADDTDEQT